MTIPAIADRDDDESGWLLLSGFGPQPIDPAILADRLHRAALIADGTPRDTDGLPLWLTLAEERVLLTYGPAAQQAYGRCTSRSPGSITPPGLSAQASTGVTIGLRLETIDSERSDRLQRLCAVAALVAGLSGATAMYWAPAQLWSSTDSLVEAVAAMEEQGLPPVLHIVAFHADRDPDGRAAQMTTLGLDWLAGHELSLRSDTAMPVADLLRRATRLAIAAMLPGGLPQSGSTAGLQPRETLTFGNIVADGQRRTLPVRIQQSGGRRWR